MPVTPSISELRSQAREWILRLSSGDISLDEIDALRIWLAEDPSHEEAFNLERATWHSLEPLQSSFEEPGGPRGTRNWKRAVPVGIAAIAASVLIMLAAPDALIRMRADHLTRAGEIAPYVLPDGSRITLDTDSAISVHFSPAERRIDLLKGRVWIDVRHDERRPLRVTALGGTTHDVGTAFEVGRHDGRVDVAVAEGIVAVGMDGQANVERLTRGQTAHYDRDGAVIRDGTIAPDEIGSWRNGELVLSATPLADAIRAIARYRSGTTLILADLSRERPVDGVLRIAQPDDAIASLINDRNLEVARLPGHITIIYSRIRER